VLYSWPQARRKVYDPNLPDKTAYYYAALKYTHWNLTVVPSDRLHDAGAANTLKIIVAGGVRVADTATLRALRAFVEKGGVLLVGEETLAEDLYGRPRDTGTLLGATVGPAEIPAPHEAPATVHGGIPLRAGIKTVQPSSRTSVILRDNRQRPVVTRYACGAGFVYFQAADLIGYNLAEICGFILRNAAEQQGKTSTPTDWRLAEIRTADGARPATNVLLSRRSYATRHAFLLMNRDEYDRTVLLRIPGLDGRWRVRQPLATVPETDTTGAALARTGVRVRLAAGAPAVVLLEK
jgi:hypothetical protein